MATILRMPEVAANATHATLVQWTKAEGEPFSAGDCIAEIETDKAVIEVNAVEDGVLGKILAQAGSDHAVGAPIAVLLAPGESADAVRGLAEDAPGRDAARTVPQAHPANLPVWPTPHWKRRPVRGNAFFQVRLRACWPGVMAWTLRGCEAPGPTGASKVRRHPCRRTPCGSPRRVDEHGCSCH